MRVVDAPFGALSVRSGHNRYYNTAVTDANGRCQRIDANPNPETAEMLRATVHPSH